MGTHARTHTHKWQCTGSQGQKRYEHFFLSCTSANTHTHKHAYMPGRWSGLSHGQHCQTVCPFLPLSLIPYTHNFLMGGLATWKIKRFLVELCWWGTYNSLHFILIPFSGKFQACQKVFSYNTEKYWVSQFCWSGRIKHTEIPRPVNEKWPWMLWPCIIPAKCVKAEAPSTIPVLLNKRHFLCYQSVSFVGSFVFLSVLMCLWTSWQPGLYILSSQSFYHPHLWGQTLHYVHKTLIGDDI